MKLARHRTNTARTAASIAGLVALLSAGLVLPHGSAEAATTVPLGTAEGFAVLASSTITNTGQTVITGDVGLHPGTSVTGFGPGADAVTQDGSLYVADGVALQAKTDLHTAYTNAADQTPVTEIPTELGGSTLTAGVYDSASGTFGLTGPLVLDGGGDPGAVFVFQTTETLITAAASTVSLVNGADSCNVFWQVGSSATLGSNSSFRGTIMADASVSLSNGAIVDGRVLARGGAVTMSTNTIANTPCSEPVVEPAPTDEATPTEEATDEPIVETTPTDEPTVEPTPTEEGTPTVEPTPVDEATDETTPTDESAPTVETTPTVEPVVETTPTEEDAPIDEAAGQGISGDRSTPIDETTSQATPTDQASGTSGGSSSGLDTPTGDTTSTQIQRVPDGSVAAGGGGDEATGDLTLALAAMVLLGALVGTVGLTTRHRLQA